MVSTRGSFAVIIFSASGRRRRDQSESDMIHILSNIGVPDFAWQRLVTRRRTRSNLNRSDTGRHWHVLQ